MVFKRSPFLNRTFLKNVRFDCRKYDANKLKSKWKLVRAKVKKFASALLSLHLFGVIFRPYGMILSHKLVSYPCRFKFPTLVTIGSGDFFLTSLFPILGNRASCYTLIMKILEK